MDAPSRHAACAFLCVVNFVATATLCFAADRAEPRDARSSKLAAELRNKGWIAFSAMSGQSNWDLFLIRPDGSAQRNITKSLDYHEVGVRFSPNGKRSCFGVCRRPRRSATIPGVF